MWVVVTRWLSVLAAIGLLGVVFCGRIAMAEERHGESSAARYEFVEVKPDDIDSLRSWAEGRCRGWTLDRMASMLGVEPTMAAVVAALTVGLDGDGERVVAETCERELRLTPES